MRRARAGIVIAVASAGACSSLACGAIFDLSALGQGGDAGAAADDAASEAGRPADAAIDAEDAGPPEEDSSAPCVFEAGAPMKRIGGYCIDTVEVTNEQYGSFLERTDGGALGAGATPAACASETDHVPTENWSLPRWSDLPVTGVSWCDAHVFCTYAGKRLCTKTSEWYRACSKRGTRRLPYGSEGIPGECATVNELRAADPPKCEGGYTGIYDMVGNAEEWSNDCESDDATASCAVQGGSALDSLADCTTTKPYPRRLKRPLVGFRCCAD